MKLIALLSAAALTLLAAALPATSPGDQQQADTAPWPPQNDPRFVDQVLRAHNWYRGPHCAQRLYWDDDLAQKAQDSVNSCTPDLHHDDIGTNLIGQGPPPDNSEDYYYLTWTYVTYSWGSQEEKLYDYNNPGFSEATGHFTQVVWRDTSRLGCAWTVCNNGVALPARMYCYYQSPGNISPLYAQNVWRSWCPPFPEFSGQSEAAVANATFAGIESRDIAGIGPPTSTPTPDATDEVPDRHHQDFQNAILDHHNGHRAKHCAQQLVWDGHLADLAFDGLAKCPHTFIHDRAGQNDYMVGPAPSSRAAWLQFTINGVEGWYSEESKYDYNHPGFSEATGHFTQHVWRDSARVGCALYDCSSATDNYPARLVCNYESFGNVDGGYEQNVWRPTC